MLKEEREVVRRARLVCSWNPDVFNTDTAPRAGDELDDLRRSVEALDKLYGYVQNEIEQGKE